MKVGIFIADSNGGYPVPASKGGAVPTLVEHLIKRNNELNIIDMEIVAYYDAEAEELSKKYANIKFRWIKIPNVIKLMDNITFWITKTGFKKKKALSYKNIFSLIYYIIESSKIIKNTSYDKIVLENNIPLAWIIKLSKYCGEYYYHFHNVPRINAKAKDVFNSCTGFLCVSRFVGNQIISKENAIGPIDKNKVKILYNCVDIENLNIKLDTEMREKKRLQYGINSNEKVVLFVGRLSEEKGVDKILDALKLLPKNVKALIVGSYLHGNSFKDDYQMKLFCLAKELEERVVFTGFVPHHKIGNIYQIADIAVLPSMWDEPAGLTMVEAMLCGIPVITTCSGGIPEYVGSYAVKLNRDNNIHENMANAIYNILYNNIDVTDMVNNGIKRIKKEFNSNDYLMKFCYGINALNES